MGDGTAMYTRTFTFTRVKHTAGRYVSVCEVGTLRSTALLEHVDGRWRIQAHVKSTPPDLHLREWIINEATRRYPNG